MWYSTGFRQEMAAEEDEAAAVVIMFPAGAYPTAAEATGTEQPFFLETRIQNRIMKPVN